MALDVGTGPGQIPIKLALRLPQLEIIGIDLSEVMLAKARNGGVVAGVESQVRFEMGDARPLPFPNHHFDLVMCNSLLHYAADPLATLNELARVTRPQGALLLRDLRRPSALVFPMHIIWFGRHYQGLKRLFTDFGASCIHPAGTRRFVSEIETCRREGVSQQQSHIGIERKSS